MTAATRLLTRSDPARDPAPVLDARAEAELVALVGTVPEARPRPARRAQLLLPGLVTTAVALLVAALTVGVLTTAPHRSAPARTPSPTTTPSALALVRHVWRVSAGGGDTWLRFGAHDVRVLRGGTTATYGWRAQGGRLLITPDDHAIGLPGPAALRWLERTTAFRVDGTGFDLLDATGAVTARLTATGRPPVQPAPVDSVVRDALADAPAVGRVAPTALIGSWTLAGVPRSDAWITFHADGSWITVERCTAAEGPETVVGGWRLLPDGVLLTTVQTGQRTACLDDHADGGATISTIGLLTRAHGVRIDGTDAVLTDRSGHRLARIVPFTD